jgi:hypothetical protein
MNTMMTDLFPDLDMPTIKSIEMSLQIVGANGSVCSVTGDLTISPLFHWKTSHSATKV